MSTTITASSTPPAASESSRDLDARQAAPTEPSRTEPETSLETPTDPAPSAEPTEKPVEEKPPQPTKEELAERALRRSFYEKREAEKRLKAAEDELARLRPARDPNAPPSPEELDRLVEQRAQMLNDRREQQARTDEWVSKGNAAYTDFTARCNTLADMGAADNPAFLDAVTRLPDGHKVIAELADNPTEAARILRLSPVQIALEVAGLSHRITTRPEPAPKPVSKAPEPIQPLATAPRAEVNLANLDGDAFLRAYRRKHRG